MSDKPKVVAWMVNCTPFAKESHADIYRAEQQHKQPLIRLSDHDTRMAELVEALKIAREYVYCELEDRKRVLDGYPHKWVREQADLNRIDGVLYHQEG